jgi:hypothetical protein
MRLGIREYDKMARKQITYLAIVEWLERRGSGLNIKR